MEAAVLPGVRADITRGKKETTQNPVVKSQVDRWKATGIIALSDCGLTVHKTRGFLLLVFAYLKQM